MKLHEESSEPKLVPYLPVVLMEKNENSFAVGVSPAQQEDKQPADTQRKTVLGGGVSE